MEEKKDSIPVDKTHPAVLVVASVVKHITVADASEAAGVTPKQPEPHSPPLGRYGGGRFGPAS
jgi:hypothetical protein